MLVRSSRLVRSSNSDLPRLEVDTWINPSIGEVGQQIHQQPNQRQDIKRRKYHRIVSIEHALEPEQADTVERKDRLDEKRAGKEGVHECPGETGDHDQHCIAKYVAIKH